MFAALALAVYTVASPDLMDWERINLRISTDVTVGFWIFDESGAHVSDVESVITLTDGRTINPWDTDCTGAYPHRADATPF